MIIDESALRKNGTGPEFWTNTDIAATCILRETGVLEACRASGVTEAIAPALMKALEVRRYRPVHYRGASVPVSYELTIALSLTPSEQRAAFRRAAFEFLTDQALSYEEDGGTRIVCLAFGDEVAPPEVSRVRRSGWTIVTHSDCPKDVLTLHAQIGRFQIVSGRGKGTASVGAGSGGDDLELTIERADAGWSFRIDKRTGYIE